MASIQKTSETASRTNPRSTPIKVDPNTINRIATSAPVNTTLVARVVSIARSDHSTGPRAGRRETIVLAKFRPPEPRCWTHVPVI